MNYSSFAAEEPCEDQTRNRKSDAIAEYTNALDNHVANDRSNGANQA